LSDKYFDGKNKEFYELKLGQLSIEEYINKFLKLLRYVAYIKDEKEKSQQFISGLPQTYWNRIEFDEPNTLEDNIGKARYCYEQFRRQTRYLCQNCLCRNEPELSHLKTLGPCIFQHLVGE
jgi:hypothetical protein